MVVVIGVFEEVICFGFGSEFLICFFLVVIVFKCVVILSLSYGDYECVWMVFGCELKLMFDFLFYVEWVDVIVFCNLNNLDGIVFFCEELC